MDSDKRKTPTRQTVQSSRDEAAPILLGYLVIIHLVILSVS